MMENGKTINFKERGNYLMITHNNSMESLTIKGIILHILLKCLIIKNNRLDRIGDYWEYYEGEFDKDNKTGFGILYLTNGDIF
jgi:hypothetical protein